ncbi:MAG: DNA polymerase III subunit gamma/tau [Actinomycetaceae bacterium]|nr:DNA polymerase III subunit gamma/tau [Actinomycetaceae bacterium]MDY6082293.1 DNA polymerase III subunit gamma/tau [Actinomycetaceae bacterium]
MSIALYRRYRPQKFQDVIGQDQVTVPLMRALRSEKTAHAYLFSGPRGCGKTTSARILAKCLNCVEYPTDTPCGKCPSCLDLAVDGPGSLDVVELDAASHGSVDDARDLVERASFMPVRDRFKIFIIDEAHMVSNQGFNALLKLVEEPPEHIRFIFATTEPEKVIPTIRSRTHHYPFHLVAPQVLESYLARICAREGIAAEQGVLPLVVRAAAGSVRDSLSVLDQLIGGAEGTTLSYDSAISLLGYTSGKLLDDFVTALADRDGTQLFALVDSMIVAGQDPRRFVEDLLQRLRDILLIALAGDEASTVLNSVPEDQYAHLVQQAQALGSIRISRSADATNDALNQMVGATAPRLQLELLCARLLLLGDDDRTQASHTDSSSGSARPHTGMPGLPAADTHHAPWQQNNPAHQAQKNADVNEFGEAYVRPAPRTRGTQRNSEIQQDTRTPQAQAENAQGTADNGQSAAQSPATQAHVAQSPATQAHITPSHAMPASSLIRDQWPKVLSALSTKGRSTYTLVSENAQPGDYDGTTATILMPNAGLARALNNPRHTEPLAQAITEALGVPVHVNVDVGTGTATHAEHAAHVEHVEPRTAESRTAEPRRAPVEPPASEPFYKQTMPSVDTSQAGHSPANSATFAHIAAIMAHTTQPTSARATSATRDSSDSAGESAAHPTQPVGTSGGPGRGSTPGVPRSNPSGMPGGSTPSTHGAPEGATAHTAGSVSGPVSTSSLSASSAPSASSASSAPSAPSPASSTSPLAPDLGDDADDSEGASADDPAFEDSPDVGIPVIKEMLGAHVIQEIKEDEQ